jgi:putative FmdB family regulatory protein
MPIYTYQCSNCGVRFDKEQSFDERNPVRCPECGKNALHRVYRPVGVVFKGSGFYSTDNRSSTRSASTHSDAKDKDKSKTDTKAPAAAPASDSASKSSD